MSEDESARARPVPRDAPGMSGGTAWVVGTPPRIPRSSKERSEKGDTGLHISRVIIIVARARAHDADDVARATSRAHRLIAAEEKIGAPRMLYAFRPSLSARYASIRHLESCVWEHKVVETSPACKHIFRHVARARVRNRSIWI